MGVEDREIGRGGVKEAGPFSLLVLFLPSHPDYLDLRIDGIKKKTQTNNKTPHQHLKSKSLNKNDLKKDMYTQNELSVASKGLISLSREPIFEFLIQFSK